MSAQDWVDVQSDWARLRDYYDSTRAANASATLTESVQKGINAQFTGIYKIIQTLSSDGRLGVGLAQGTITRARWVTTANEAGQMLASIRQQFNEEDLYNRAWAEIVVPTAVGAKQFVADAIDTGQSITTTIIIVLVLVLAIKVLK